jgi:hypothetical protein
MVPNWKKPSSREYISDILERPLTDEDLEMIKYFEDLERKERAINEFVKHLERRYKESRPGEGKMTYYTIIKELKVFLGDKHERRR